jgi:hypothetical protein
LAVLWLSVTRRARCSSALLLLAFACLALPAGSTAQEPAEKNDVPAPLPGSDITTPSELVLVPAFPGSRALRLRLETLALPAAGLEDKGSVDMVRTGLRVRAPLSLTPRLTLQATGRYGLTHYGFDGEQDFFDGARRVSRDPFGVFHDASLSLQSAFVLNPQGHLFFAMERWSLLGEVFGAARWEDDAFGGGMFAGGGLAIGYEFPGRLQLALGVSLRSQIADNSLGVDPIFSLSWRVTQKLTLRTRGRGAQIEYRWSRRFLSYATAFRSGRSWRLEKRQGVPGNSILSDQQLRSGLGFEWLPHSQLRIQLETGVIATRQIEVDVRGSGSLSEIDGQPSAYLVVAFELRP